MAFTSIFPRRAPRIGVNSEWVSFDAVLEDSLEYKVDYTQFPIEIGASATDHGIIRPIVQTLTIATSNNPLKVGVSDFASSLINELASSPAFATVSSLSSGFLSSDSETRGSEVLKFFVALMYSRVPFDVDSVDTTLSNMVITNLRRTRDTVNEDGLILLVEMQELALLSTTITQNQPSITQLNDNDPAQSQAAADQNKGEVLVRDASPSTELMVEGLL